MKRLFMMAAVIMFSVQAIYADPALESLNVLGSMENISVPIPSSSMEAESTNAKVGYLSPLPISAYCGVSVQRLDVEQCVIAEEKKITLPFRKLVPSNPNDNRLWVKGNFIVRDNYEVIFKAVFAPGGWIDGKDILIIESYLQRKEAGEKVTVLVLGEGNSATTDTLPNPNYNLFSSLKMKNPEVITAILNAGGNLTACDAVKQGLVPNRIASSVHLNCSVNR